MKLSIVSTLYLTEPHIEEFHRRASAAAKQLAGDDYELILVNDGSPDNSLICAIELSGVDKHIVIIDLSRNFGHHKAMMTGLAHASGEQIFLIDSDLEEDPECLLSFAKQKSNDLCDVVYGVQEKRKGGLFERISGFLFYRILRLLTGLEIADNIVVARLMSRRYVEALLLHGESEIFLAGLWAITGFDQRPQKLIKHSSSKSTYTLRKKLSQMVNSITSFTNTPLLIMFFIGCIIFLLAGLYGGYLVANWIFWSRPPDGYTSLMASVWFLGGMIAAFLGIIGIYLSKIYSETKHRPKSIIRAIYKNKQDNTTSLI